MSIGSIINDYGKKQSPYMGGLVNHLPMGQLAIYKMTEDLEAVKAYSEKFATTYRIDEVKTEYPKMESLEDCLGGRDLYESALDILKEEVGEEEKEKYIRDTLNRYKLGMSSGLFHVLIRLAYSVEGYEMDKELLSEVQRALSYYITAYREARVFKRKIQGQNILAEMEKLSKDENVLKTLRGKNSLGQKMKSLYEDEYYLSSGFVVEGSQEEKIESILKLAVAAYANTGSIVALHCITGTHALLVLREYYKDFSEAIDIFTTCVITHLIAGDILEYDGSYATEISLSWSEILRRGAESLDVHAVKLAYSAHELYAEYGLEELKYVAIKRIGSE